MSILILSMFGLFVKIRINNKVQLCFIAHYIKIIHNEKHGAYDYSLRHIFATRAPNVKVYLKCLSFVLYTVRVGHIF